MYIYIYIHIYIYIYPSILSVNEIPGNEIPPFTAIQKHQISPTPFNLFFWGKPGKPTMVATKPNHGDPRWYPVVQAAMMTKAIK